jgi:putative tryptophan/tyrosine transport system substrate-binding protein
MNRREFISLIGGAAVWPVAARAQQGDRMRRIGALMNYGEDDPDSRVRLPALLQGLDKLGWMVGRNLTIDYRWDIIDVDRARAAATELVALGPDVILANSTPAVQGLQTVTRTVPSVFTLVTEPVAQGFVQSLARPDGNLTGFSYLAPTVGGKWFDLLTQIAPSVSRAAFIFNPPASPYGGLFYGSIQQNAARFNVKTALVPIQESGELERVLADLGHEPGGGLIVDPDNFTSYYRGPIIDLAARYRLPAIYSRRFFASAGGLMAYGVDDVEHFRQVAVYLDRILRGAKPADLPVQEPTKFELVINLKTAKALGLIVPPSLLAVADEVIE